MDGAAGWATLSGAALETRKPLAKIGKRKKKCAICREPFQKTRPIQPTCPDIECSLEYVRQRRIEKAVAPYLPERSGTTKAVREFNENDLKYVAKQARSYFHRWIKWRDRGLPCCACGKDMSRLSEWDKQASHYRPSKMNSAIRYHPDNVHLGCSHCNNHRSGNESEYRVRLVEKIGIERVEWLESQRQVKRWSIEELRDIRDLYKPQLVALGIPLPRVR